MLEYNEAQAEYFDLTIGNAPWPTMLGAKSNLFHFIYIFIFIFHSLYYVFKNIYL